MATPDQKVAESIGVALDREISYLVREREVLIAAPARISEIEAELIILQSEKSRIDPRRPPVAPAGPVVSVPAVDTPLPGRVR